MAKMWSLSASPHHMTPFSSFLLNSRCTGLSFSQNLSSASGLRLLWNRSRGFGTEGGNFVVQAAVQQRRGPGATRKKVPFPKPKRQRVLLKPPLDDSKLAEKFLNSPQLSLKNFPLLSSCLPQRPLNEYDVAWMDEFMLEAKDALGLASMEAVDGTPSAHLDTLLYLAFQHPESPRAKRAPYVRNGHSRLWFLGHFVLELAMAEMFLQMFPREATGSLRERAFGLTNKKALPEWLKAAAMDRLVYPEEDLDLLKRDVREAACKSVFWALIGAIYLTLGMPEVYRVLFEVFGFDVDAKSCQPKSRNIEDVDYLSPELDGRRLTWQEIAYYQPPEGALFAEPRLFRACVPPGMHRFRGNYWESESLPIVRQKLGYPLPEGDTNPEEAAARRTELELGLQLCFLHPSTFKLEHPRFCYERLEYLGQKIQDVVMAEKLLMKHLDGPGLWLQEKHRRILLNRLCGRYLRDLKLHHHIVFSDDRKELFEKARRLRNFATTGVSQAIHGLGYAVYGRPDVRRLMFRVFNFEQLESPIQ